MKKTDRFQNQAGFIGLIGLLIALIIIAWLTLKVFNQYYGPSLKSSAGSAEDKGFFAQQGIDTSTQGAVLDSVKAKLGDIQKTTAGRLKDLG